MTKKYKTFLIISILTFIVLILILTPYVKIWAYSHHYETIGSYLLLNDDRNAKINLKPIHLDTISEEITANDFDITNILYYKDLKQLSFGLIKNKSNKVDYDLTVMKIDQNVSGKFMTEGHYSYSKKLIEKVHYILEDNILENQEYMIKIMDTDKNIVGTVKFKLPK